MSIAVPLEDLAAKLADYPWGYLVTVRDDGRAQSLAVPTVVDGDAHVEGDRIEIAPTWAVMHRPALPGD